jgi:hypothetical protein
MIKITNLVHNIILFGLILTPLFSFYESSALIFGGLVNNSTALTPPWIKVGKDIVFISVILLCFFLNLKRMVINYITLFSALLAAMMIFIPAIFTDHILLYFSGIRWLLPFIAALLLIGHVDEILLLKVGKVLFYLFILHLFFQCIQLFFSDGWFGLYESGLSKRNPGLFFIPSTAAIYSILVLFFSKFYMDFTKKKIISILMPISIFLTASGTGIALYIIFLIVFRLKDKFIPLSPLVLLLLAGFLFVSLDTLSGRAGLLEDSFGARLIMFKDVFADADYLATNFGSGTSTGYLIENRYGYDFDMAVTDSFYASAIANLGLLNVFIFLLFLIMAFYVAIFKKNKEILLFLLIYSLISMTVVFTEAFPVNLLFSILSAYYFKNNSSLYRAKLIVYEK